MTAKIALIEDDTALAQMYQFKLQQAEFEVKLAADGQSGMELIEQFLPDLILLDIKMPIMNGDEMLEKVRSEAWGQKAKVIILTNISRDEAPKILRFLRIDRYIVKAHHTPQQVLEIVRETLK